MNCQSRSQKPGILANTTLPQHMRRSILLVLREEDDIVYLITEMLFVVRHSRRLSGSEHLVAYRLPPDLTFGLSESSRSKSDLNGSKLEDKSHT